MTTPTWKCEDDIVSGLWKFDPVPTLEELQEFAEHLNDSETPGWGYQGIYIRGVGKDGALGIGFRYQLSGLRDPDTLAVVKTAKKAKEEFFHRATDKLKRSFGNSFVGWDLSIPTWTLITS